MNDNNKTVIIIGGGIAGLVAARELSSKYNIVLIEAASRLGGRIYSYHDESFPMVEAGAEFIHGEGKFTLPLLKEAGIRHLPVEGKMYRKEKGNWIELEEMVEGWDELLKKMKKVKEDTTMYAFLQEHFGGDKHADLRRHAIAFAEGFDIADVKKASVKALYKEWAKTEDHYRIPSGYGSLIRFLASECTRKGCQLITGEPVTQVDWEPGEITVYTTGDKKYYADKLIVTVPVSILQQALGKAAINFTPPLDEYVKASQQVGFGKVIKVVVQCNSIFWKEDMGFVFSDEQFPTWWTQLPDKIPLLTGWAGGSKAELLQDHTDEELLEKAILSLANIFDQPVPLINEKIVAARVFDWQKNDWSCGAYSYATPETHAARELLNTPVENTIFFTGEAIDDGNSPGTIEGAIAHTYMTVKMLVERDTVIHS